jgi:excisionase family DNA binding protein
MSMINSVNETKEAEDDRRSVSTAQAARMLGLSTTMLQKLVDQGRFQAWKTPGGHRRIDLMSVLFYQRKLKMPDGVRTKSMHLPVVKVIVDEEAAATDIHNELREWSKSFEVSFWTSMPDALLSFATQLPDILIVQMSMPLHQQAATVSALEKFVERARKPLSVTCLTDLPDLRTTMHQGLHSSIQILRQALTREWLNAFLSGAAAASTAVRTL